MADEGALDSKATTDEEWLDAQEYPQVSEEVSARLEALLSPGTPKLTAKTARPSHARERKAHGLTPEQRRHFAELGRNTPLTDEQLLVVAEWAIWMRAQQASSSDE